jgi:hypothetical protein
MCQIIWAAIFFTVGPNICVLGMEGASCLPSVAKNFEVPRIVKNVCTPSRESLFRLDNIPIVAEFCRPSMVLV